MHISKSPETSRKSISEYIINTERKKFTRGARSCPRGWGRAPYLVGPLVALRRPSSAIWSLSTRKKMINHPSGRDSAATRRNQSRAPAELFCRGHFPPGGGNDRQRSSHRERAISINIFTSTISSQTLVHLLYPIHVFKSEIGTCRLLVVLITPCS